MSLLTPFIYNLCFQGVWRETRVFQAQMKNTTLPLPLTLPTIRKLSCDHQTQKKCPLNKSGISAIQRNRSMWCNKKKTGKKMERGIFLGLRFGEKYYANWGSNPWPSDHDSIFHVTETSVLTTWLTMLCKWREVFADWKISWTPPVFVFLLVAIWSHVLTICVKTGGTIGT